MLMKIGWILLCSQLFLCFFTKKYFYQVWSQYEKKILHAQQKKIQFERSWNLQKTFQEHLNLYEKGFQNISSWKVYLWLMSWKTKFLEIKPTIATFFSYTRLTFNEKPFKNKKIVSLLKPKKIPTHLSSYLGFDLPMSQPKDIARQMLLSFS